MSKIGQWPAEVTKSTPGERRPGARRGWTPFLRAPTVRPRRHPSFRSMKKEEEDAMSARGMRALVVVCLKAASVTIDQVMEQMQWAATGSK